MIVAWLAGRHDGKRAAGAQAAQRRIEAIERAQEVDDEMADLDADELRRRAHRWVRDDGR